MTINKILSNAKRIKELEEELKKLKSDTLKAMEETTQKTIECNGVRVTYIEGCISYNFDSSLFKKEHEELYNQYKKERLNSPSIRITIK